MLMRIKRLKLFGNFYHYCGLGFLKTWLVYMDPVCIQQVRVWVHLAREH